MKNMLVVVDMQNDFIDGALGTPEAVSIVPAAEKLIRGWTGDIIATRDTHFADSYPQSREGRYLPVPHCIRGTEGHRLRPEIARALDDYKRDHPGRSVRFIDKYTFGSVDLPGLIGGKKSKRIVFCGLCTDICVVSNAMLVKAAFPEADVAVVSDACAGVTPESHASALATMKMCQIDVIRTEDAI